MDLPKEAKRAPSAPVWNQSFPSTRSKKLTACDLYILMDGTRNSVQILKMYEVVYLEILITVSCTFFLDAVYSIVYTVAQNIERCQ